jgi:hypothetical protein
MPILDIFNDDAFSLTSLTDAIERTEYKPSFLGSLGIFSPRPIMGHTFGVEERDGFLTLISASERGTPPSTGTRRRRRMRNFEAIRLAKETRIYAHEVQNVRAFGSETQLETVAGLVDDRLNGDVGLVSEMELTWELHRLGALRGEVYDADGTTLLFSWFDEFGIAAPGEVNFALGTPTTNVRQKCTDMIRAMARASKGAFAPGTTIHAICGDAFYDALISHPEVIATYQNWIAAQELRNAAVNAGGNSWGSFSYGGITFHNYRGMDDGTRLTVDTDKAHFFPIGARGVFAHVQSSGGEFEETVNTIGRPMYAMILKDKDRGAWVQPEVYSYPLFICQRPELLMKARRA